MPSGESIEAIVLSGLFGNLNLGGQKVYVWLVDVDVDVGLAFRIPRLINVFHFEQVIKPVHPSFNHCYRSFFCAYRPNCALLYICCDVLWSMCLNALVMRQFQLHYSIYYWASIYCWNSLYKWETKFNTKGQTEAAIA